MVMNAILHNPLRTTLKVLLCSYITRYCSFLLLLLHYHYNIPLLPLLTPLFLYLYYLYYSITACTFPSYCTIPLTTITTITPLPFTPFLPTALYTLSSFTYTPLPLTPLLSTSLYPLPLLPTHLCPTSTVYYNYA